jgi:FtsZ-interacting cell division protein ZipA
MFQDCKLGLIGCLIITIGYLGDVQAVTDAELEALEKQIEQQEAEEIKRTEAAEKKKADAEAKRKAEQKRKANAEAEKKRAAELEKKRIEKEDRLAKESKVREEEEKKKKYTMLITEAEQAVTNKDKELAMTKYNEALLLYPNSPDVNEGIMEAEKLMEKVCYQFVGTWVVKMFIGEGMIQIMEDGTLYFGNTKEYPTSWVCYPEKNQIKDNQMNMFYTLIESGTCLTGPGTGMGGDSCYRRVD